MCGNEPELKNFWNLKEGFTYLWLSVSPKSASKTVAWATFKNYWGWPLLTVCILEVFWHSVFHFVVGW